LVFTQGIDVNESRTEMVIVARVVSTGVFRIKINLQNYESTYRRTPWTGDRPIGRTVPTQGNTT